jgi:hypothetical protein
VTGTNVCPLCELKGKKYKIPKAMAAGSRMFRKIKLTG